MRGSGTDDRVRAAFAAQADWCDRLGSPFTATLCRLLGDRIDDGSAVGRRVLDWRGDPAPGGDALALRLCGGLHALVRRGAAPGLARLYPPNQPAGDDPLWAEIRTALDLPALGEWLDRPPQTNEVGRSAVLMAGLLAVTVWRPQPVELLELGASAGLNLLLDRYGYHLCGVAAGDATSLLLLDPDWTGPPPPAVAVKVAGRRGVDLCPLRAETDDETLLAYVWPDQANRLAELQAALAIARAGPPAVDRGDAADWLETQLTQAQPDGVTRVVLHSVAFQYFPQETQARISAAIDEAARAGRPLAWLRYEKLAGEDEFSLRLRTWPDGGDQLLAWCHPHGRWIRWMDAI